ncbi:MAG TPA: P-loop NTPase fold protein [Hymenobacter sp.]|jgi:hypothetical protein|uniref:P-loop NTPase fold protein n=1 Tax=Hymenobacter sp. TaxID=1898978 RepID=UPI002EDA20A3
MDFGYSSSRERSRFFAIYNRHEPEAVTVLNQLQSHDLVLVGQQPESNEAAALKKSYAADMGGARAGVAILGRAGWDKDNLLELGLARGMNVPIVLLLLDGVTPDFFEQYRPYLDSDVFIDARASGALPRLAQFLRSPNERNQAIASLEIPIPVQEQFQGDEEQFRPDENGQPVSEAVPPTDSPPFQIDSRFEGIIGVFVDGDELARADQLRRLDTLPTEARAGLAQRLRHELQIRFSTDSDDFSITSNRPPQALPAIRSWLYSALIHCDAEGLESKAFILRRVDPSEETDDTVRFWMLAELYTVRSSYLMEVQRKCLKDPVAQVSRLAMVLGLEQNPGDLRRLQNELSNRGLAWPVLRALRVVAVPQLVEPVCQLFAETSPDQALAYDAIYALAHPKMIPAAVAPLIRLLGLEKLVGYVLRVARKATPSAVRAFTRLLAAFDAAGVATALAEAENDPQIGRIAQEINRVLPAGPEPLPDASFLPGYRPDTATQGQDFLGIQEDVRTLTAVMLAREVTPPLAIGLFGDWGTGKSYFMKSMQRETQALTQAEDAATRTAYCANVLEIEFNAWHYVDTNLWASLASVIFSKLAHHSQQRLQPETEQQQLDARLSRAQQTIAEHQQAKQQTEEKLLTLQNQLAVLERDRTQKKTSLWELSPAALASLFTDDPELKARLDQTAARLGLPAAYNSVADLSQAAADVRTSWGRFSALVYAIGHSRNRYLLLAIIAFILVGIPVISGVLEQHFPDQMFVKLAAWIGQFGAAAAALATVIGQALTKVNAGIATVTEAKQKAEKILAQSQREQSPEEIAIATEIEKLELERGQEERRLEAAQQEAAAAANELLLLKEKLSLAYFLKERNRSEDFTKHLGLITVIRRDFEELAKRLQQARDDEAQKAGAVDRIVLYIDDLDRCPTKTVMDVLEAIHLLLAYELFVVVVGVDPAWLQNSLHATHSIFQAGPDRPELEAGLQQPTPQKFLEKIFQIPFCLRPMTARGYGRLMGNLLAPHLAAAASAKPPVAPAEEPAVLAAAEPASATPTGLTAPLAAPVRELAPSPSPEPVTERPAVPTFAVAVEALTMQPWEAQFAESLYEFIPSPRAAKRFANIYRLLKAALRREDLQQFEGTAAAPGTFRVPMALLAFLVGCPEEATALFPRLQDHAAAGRDMRKAWVDDPTPEPSLDESTVGDKVARLVNRIDFPLVPELYQEWLPRVARFSFALGRTVKPAGETVPG